MQRTTIVADEGTLLRLRRLAERRGVSLGHVIREALEDKVSREQPTLHFVGRAENPGSVDARTADEHDHYRAESYRGA